MWGIQCMLGNGAKLSFWGFALRVTTGRSSLSGFMLTTAIGDFGVRGSPGDLENSKVA